MFSKMNQLYCNSSFGMHICPHDEPLLMARHVSVPTTVVSDPYAKTQIFQQQALGLSRMILLVQVIEVLLVSFCDGTDGL